MKLLPGPLLIPSLVLGGGLLVIQALPAPSDLPAVLMALGGFVTAMTVGFALVWKTVVRPKLDKIETKADEGIAIGMSTNKMADGRLDAVTKQLAESETKVAKLVNDGVMTAADELLTKAAATGEAMMAKAAATAEALLAEARKEAQRAPRTPAEDAETVIADLREQVRKLRGG